MWRWVHNCCDRKTTIVSPDDDITILTDEELSRTPTKIIRLMNQVIPFQRDDWESFINKDKDSDFKIKEKNLGVRSVFQNGYRMKFWKKKTYK